MYVAFDLHSENSLFHAIEKLKCCIGEISQWMSNNRLKLNEDKTEVIIFKTPRYRQVICVDEISLSESPIEVPQSVRNI